MRGTKAKAIAKIVEKYEPRTTKHGQKHYQVNDKGTLRIIGGFSLLYKTFKKAYKQLDRKTVDEYMRRESND